MSGIGIGLHATCVAGLLYKIYNRYKKESFNLGFTKISLKHREAINKVICREADISYYWVAKHCWIIGPKLISFFFKQRKCRFNG